MGADGCSSNGGNCCYTDLEYDATLWQSSLQKFGVKPKPTCLSRGSLPRFASGRSALEHPNSTAPARGAPGSIRSPTHLPRR